MIKLHLDEGLNDEQVLRNRKVYGDNSVSYSNPFPFKLRMLGAIRHLFSIIMLALIALTFVFALKLNENEQIGEKVFAMPIACAIATLFVIFIAMEGGLKRRGFLILTILAVLQLGVTVYEYIFTESDFFIFFHNIGLFLCILLVVLLNNFFIRKKYKNEFLLNIQEDGTPTKVIRNNTICLIKRNEIVVGDLLIIHKGEIVPADCQIIEGINLQVDESIHHESNSIRNYTEDKNEFENQTSQRPLCRGWLIVDGYCIAKVTKVGDSVRFSEQIGFSKFKETDNSFFQEKTSRIASKFYIITCIFAILFCCVRFYTWFFGGVNNEQMPDGGLQAVKIIIETFLIASTALIFADRSVFTNACNSTIALNLMRMKMNGFIPYSFHSFYNLAATNLLCLDETKFLSGNLCKVSYSSFNNISNERLVEMIAANTTAYIIHETDNKQLNWGDSIEIAMLEWVMEQSSDYILLRNKVTFVDRRESKDNHSLATIVKSDEIPGKHLVYVKGDPDYIMKLTDMTLAEIEECENQLHECWNKGWKTVAFAFGIINEEENPFVNDILNLHNLNFAGFLAFEFSPADNLKQSLACIESLGVDVMFYANDNQISAHSFANALGVLKNDDDKDLSDSNLTHVNNNDNDSEKLNKHINFSYFESENHKQDYLMKQKSRYSVITLFEHNAHGKQELIEDDDCVILTDQILSDKYGNIVNLFNTSLSTLYKAIILGRAIINNIRFYILYYLTFSAVIGGLLLWNAFSFNELIISSTNLLWVFIILNFIALPALALSPRIKYDFPHEFKLNEILFTKKMMLYAIVFACVILAILIYCLYFINNNNLHSLYNFLTVNLPHHPGVNSYERSILFMGIILFSFWQLINIKSFKDESNALRVISNSKIFFFVSFIILISSFSLMQFGGYLIGSAALEISDWIAAIVVTSAIVWINELFFLLTRKKHLFASFGKRQMSLLPSRLQSLKKVSIKCFKWLTKWSKSSISNIFRILKNIFKWFCKLLIKLLDYIQKKINNRR